MHLPERKSTRLKGYDYSEPGEYFVTICTKERKCLLGEVVDGVMRLSEAGRIVETCWKEIPGHFENTRVGVFQIMPNHVHGIIEIREMSGRGLMNQTLTRHGSLTRDQTPSEKNWILMKDPRVTLGKIIRSFKARSTRLVRRAGKTSFGWQRNYYDHIIRSDIDKFFVEQYIETNPIMWELDSDNPKARSMPMEEFSRTMKEEHHLTGYALQRVIEYESAYRQREAE